MCSDKVLIAKEVESLKRERDDYRRLFEEADVAILIIDKQGGFIDCNRAYFGLFDYNDRRSFGPVVPIDISPERQPDGCKSIDKVDDLTQQALTQGKCCFEWMHKKQSGETFLSYVTLEVISFHGQEAMRATISDLSEQRKLERLVEERTAELVLKTQALERLAMTDNLTHLYNRNRLDEVLTHEWQRFQRYNHTFGAILIDIDYFKNVNDTYGHQTGDQVLIELSTLLKQHARLTDTVGRWGGEEFLIILPEIHLNDVQMISENIRQCIESKLFTKLIKITASFGGAVFKSGNTIESFLSRLDKSLYDAKHKGRNRVGVSV